MRKRSPSLRWWWHSLMKAFEGMNMDAGFRKYIKALNIQNNGSIIYTGNPVFNERYLSKRRTLRMFLSGNFPKPLATREQELELAAKFYKDRAIAFLPKVDAFYKNKKIRRVNAKKDRKVKPNKEFLINSRNNYYHDHGTYQGWLKAVKRDLKLCEKTINIILKE